MKSFIIFFVLVVCFFSSTAREVIKTGLMSFRAGIYNSKGSPISGNVFVDSSVSSFKAPSFLPHSRSFHLISHGAPGRLFLYNQWMNAGQIACFLKPILPKNIKHINVYGCQFAKGEEGRKAVIQLEHLLHISVAASTNITGKDGDWKLEIGDDGTACTFNKYKENLQYQPYYSNGTPVANGGENQDYDGDGINNTLDRDDDNDGVIDSVETLSGCNLLYSFTNSRVTWNATSQTNYTSTFTKNGASVNVSAVISPTSTNTPVFLGLASSGYNYGGGTYVGCPDGISPVANSVILVNTTNYTVTVTFSVPVKDPSINFSSFNVANVNFTQQVYVAGSQPDGNGLDSGPYGTFNAVPVLGTYINTIPPIEGLASIIFPGYYTSISFSTAIDGNAAFSVAVGEIMPLNTPAMIASTYVGSEDIDTDNDGIPNRFDLDSDGDHCPDAFESNVPGNLQSGSVINSDGTHTYPKAFAPGPYGANGLADYLEAGGIDQGAAGVTSYISKYSIGMDSGVKCPQVTATSDQQQYTIGSPLPVVINVLANDNTGGTPDSTSVSLIAPAGATKDSATGAVTVPGQGVWTVNHTTGKVTFTPNVGFAGPPGGISYRVRSLYSDLSTPANISWQVVLDINVVSFTAQWNSSRPLVTWQATGQIGNFYELERSTDASRFKTIYKNFVRIPNVIENYTFSDDAVVLTHNPGRSLYYRLKMDQGAGRTTYSNIVTLREYDNPSLQFTKVVPNPSNGNIHFSSLNDVSNIEFRTITGQLLKRVTNPNPERLDYHLEGFSAGTYLILITKQNGFSERLQIVIGTP